MSMSCVWRGRRKRVPTSARRTSRRRVESCLGSSSARCALSVSVPWLRRCLNMTLSSHDFRPRTAVRPFSRTDCASKPDLPDRQRDLFPLPLLKAVALHNDENRRSFVSAKFRRRAGACRHAIDDCNHTIRPLNVLNGHSFNCSSPVTAKPTLAQRQCLKHIQDSVVAFGAPPDPHLTPTEALQELRVSHD